MFSDGRNARILWPFGRDRAEPLPARLPSVVTALALALALALAHAANAAALIATPSSLDLGEFSSTSSPPTKSLKLTNSSDHAVTIESISFGCSCLSGDDISGKVLRPKESLQMRVSVKVPPFAARDGKYLIDVRGTGDDSRLRIPITYQFKPDLVLSKETMLIDDDQAASSSLDRDQVSIDDLTAAVQFISVECDNKFISVATHETKDSDGVKVHSHRFTVETSLEPDAPAGRYSAIVTVLTDSKTTPLISIPVLATLLAKVRPVPETVIVNNAGAWDLKYRDISLLNCASLKIKSITSFGVVARAWQVPSEKASDIAVRLEVRRPKDDMPRGPRNGDAAGSVTVEFDATNGPIRIPVFFLVD